MIVTLLAVIAAAVVWIALSNARGSRGHAAAGIEPTQQVVPTSPPPTSTREALVTPVEAADMEPFEQAMMMFDTQWEHVERAMKNSNLKEACDCTSIAVQASWRAVQELGSQWFATWNSPPDDPGLLRDAVTYTLEELCEKRGQRIGPLSALLLSTTQLYNICAAIAERERIELVLPSSTELDALEEAERAVGSGAESIARHKAAIDSAFLDLVNVWERYGEALDSGAQTDELLASLADVVRAAKDTSVTLRVVRPILQWG